MKYPIHKKAIANKIAKNNRILKRVGTPCLFDFHLNEYCLMRILSKLFIIESKSDHESFPFSKDSSY